MCAYIPDPPATATSHVSNGNGHTPTTPMHLESSQSVRAKDSRKEDFDNDERANKQRRVEVDITDPANPFHFIGALLSQNFFSIYIILFSSDLVRKGKNVQEFVYCVPIDKDSAEHNPFNLSIVPHSMIDRLDFYTISSSGVTHFINEVAGTCCLFGSQ